MHTGRCGGTTAYTECFHTDRSRASTNVWHVNRGGKVEPADSVSHDRRVNTGLQDFYVADGRADGARCLSSVTDNQQRSGARRPERQPLRAAAGGRDGGLGDGRESDVLHADTDPESAGVSAEVCSQPEPAKSEGRDRFPHAVSGIYVFNELPFITDLHAVTNLFVVYESFETNVPHWWFSEIKENSKSFRNNIF